MRWFLRLWVDLGFPAGGVSRRQAATALSSLKQAGAFVDPPAGG